MAVVREDERRPDYFAKAVGARICAQRMAVGLTVGELAAKVGTTNAAVASWEGGYYAPRLTSLVNLCHALGCQPGMLIGWPGEDAQSAETDSGSVTLHSEPVWFARRYHDDGELADEVVSDNYDVARGSYDDWCRPGYNG